MKYAPKWSKAHKAYMSNRRTANAVAYLTTSRHQSHCSFPPSHYSATRSISSVSFSYVLQQLVFRRLERAKIWLLEFDSRRRSIFFTQAHQARNVHSSHRTLTTLFPLLPWCRRARLPEIFFLAQLLRV